MSFRTDIERFLEPLTRRVMGMVAKAKILASMAGKNIDVMKIDLGHGEIKSSVDSMQDYGLASKPVNGAQAIVLMITGSRDHPVIVATDDYRYRPVLLAGEVALYSKFGQVIKLNKNNKISIGNGTQELLDLFDQLLVRLETSVVPTLMGPQHYLV